ncbi:MAG: glycosyltransferase family 39 protein [Candidatus Sumerlaeia bacterium]
MTPTHDQPQDKPGEGQPAPPADNDNMFRIVEPDAQPRPQEPAAKPAEGARFDIEWFDESSPPESGHMFAEPAPEPPPAPFEIVHDPDKPRHAKKKGPAAEAAQAPAPAAEKKFALPPIWIRVFWGFMPLILMVAGYASVLLTQGKVGYAWDEAYYYEPSAKAADWLTEVVCGKKPFGREAIDEYWGDLHEHPSVQKFLSGIALRTFTDPMKSLGALRIPSAILFGMTLALLYMLGRRAFGPMSGLIAAILYATLPRVFGHAHFATMEPALLFMMLLVVFCFLRGLDHPFWAAMTGISFGLLLATKINGFFLPIPLILWGHLYARRRYTNNLFAMLTLGPAVMVAAWPWLWHDTAARLLEYLHFHAVHQKTAVFFMGQRWGYNVTPNAPWYYPSVMFWITTPIVALVLIAVGALRTLVRPHLRPYGALFMLCALAMWAVASAPDTPKYDGVRLFLPMYPFLALLGGSGFVSLIRRIEWLVARGNRDPNRGEWFVHKVAFAFALLLLVDGGGSIWRYYPYMLSYYNPFVGGLRGAASRYESIYWGEALNHDTIDVLNALPQGSRIKPLAMHEKCFIDLQHWGLLDPTLRIGGDPPYDYHILQFRRGFFGRPERALADSGRFKQIHEVQKGGAPLLGIYQTGIPFEQYWPTLPMDAPPPRPE